MLYRVGKRLFLHNVELGLGNDFEIGWQVKGIEIVGYQLFAEGVDGGNVRLWKQDGLLPKMFSQGGRNILT